MFNLKLNLQAERARHLEGLIVTLGRTEDPIPVAEDLCADFGLILPRFEHLLRPRRELWQLRIDPEKKRQLARFIDHYGHAERTGQDASAFAFELCETFGLMLPGWAFHWRPGMAHAYRFTRTEHLLRPSEEPAEEAAQ